MNCQNGSYQHQSTLSKDSRSTTGAIGLYVSRFKLIWKVEEAASHLIGTLESKAKLRPMLLLGIQNTLIENVSDAKTPTRKQTSIPVPEIHAYDSGQMTIGWPFILMDYKAGYPAHERMSIATPEQDSHFLQQMASIQSELANVKLHAIGSVFSKADGFEVRADVETAKGPFSQPKDYYLAVALQRHKRFADVARSSEISSTDLPALLALMIHAGYGPDDGTDDVAEKEYGLANRDLVPRNLLIDDNFNIVGMIDLDFVVAAPKHVTATLPSRFGSQLDVRTDDLGVAKRTKEYFAALAKAGKPKFETLVKSP